jgi:malonate transporter and related proteins
VPLSVGGVLAVLGKLVAIFAVIGVGWAAGRFRVVEPEAAGVLAGVTFSVFTPALLFRTTSGIAVSALPWGMLTAYFVPAVGLLLLTFAWRRARVPEGAVWGLAVSFSNTVQLGVPVVSALFGAAGLQLLVGIISLQSLVLLTTATVLVELGMRDGERGAVRRTVRRSLVHPVVSPILLGLAYHATGLPLPQPVDDVLSVLGSAVVPLSLFTIGLTLRLYGVRGHVRPAATMTALKLLVLPALVLATAYLSGLRGLPLHVAVLCAALPIGANVLLFANRYNTLQPESTAAIVASTTAFLLTAPLWLIALSSL